VDVVPKIVVGGSGPGGAGGGAGSSLLEALLAIVLSDKLGEGTRSESVAAPELEQLRTGIRRSLMANLRAGDNGKAVGKT
jgi:hypothetical protein